MGASYVTIGAAFSANKGAAAMLETVLDRLSQDPGSSVKVLTTYPSEDSFALKETRAEILSAKPLELLLVMLPISLLAFVLRKLGLSPRTVCRTRSTRAIAEADVVLDLAGISFADGRGIPILGYNVLMTGVPLLIGTPVIKCAQALGPFRSSVNRAAARLVLPRVRTICARGESTYAHLIELGLGNVIEAADLAFLLEMTARDEMEARTLVGDGGEYVAVAPSSVVRKYCESIGVDYVRLMASFVDDVINSGERVVLFAHSYRPGLAESRMNDVPVCRDIHGALENPGGCVLLDGDYRPKVLRALIAGSKALVTSRFHAMISALATRTPVLVVGWSHKYAEVMKEFELEGSVIRFEDVESAGIHQRLQQTLAAGEDIMNRIAANLPKVMSSSEANFQAIRDVVTSG